jgi:2'-5' RNA ligase
MRRTFIGLKIEPDLRIFQLFDELKDGLNYSNFHWIDPENLHLTLRFIGDSEEDQIQNIIRQLEILMPGFHSFEMEINGLGIFGSKSFPRILWAGIKMPIETQDLIRSIDNVVCDAGFERETRSFSPHLTLCRIKNLKETNGLNFFLKKYEKSTLKKQEIREINLYESILLRSGAVYKTISSFTLNSL